MIWDEAIQAFLAQHGRGHAMLTHLAQDASPRRYARVTHSAGTDILMIAPPETCGSQDRFVTIARHLHSIGLSAPEIYAYDADQGLMLLEDLGTEVVAHRLEAHPEEAETLYRAAVDMLVRLHEAPHDLQMLDHGTPTYLTNLADLAYDEYLFALGVKADKDAGLAGLHQALTEANLQKPVIALRDNHAENLLWLPDRIGPARIGILDFQDAILCDPVYDIVSMLTDARRDVDTGFAQKILAYYASVISGDLNELSHRYAILGVQRNLRILGIFTRLARTRRATHYIDYIPRVWGYIETCLTHPALVHLRPQIQGIFPPPTQDILTRLKSQ